MIWKIDYKEEITAEYVSYLYNLLRTHIMGTYSDAKLILMQTKAKQFTNDYSLKKTLGEYLSFLITTDSDIKTMKRDLDKCLMGEEKIKELQEFTEIGYFLNKNKNLLFIGKEFELEFMEITLSRKIKNNLLIIGQPGTGKTTLVSQYNKQTDKRIFVVEMGKIISNTKYRGEFENKLIKLIEYSREERIILFIDEIHIIFSSGKVDGGLSAADILKPYLTDSELIIIGTTTIEEFKIMMSDKAIERRFNLLTLGNMENSVLRNLYQELLSSFGITTLTLENFEDIQKALDKVSNRNYPDKLIDFIDLYEAIEKFNGRTTINEVIQRGFYEFK
ncbi:AAA family ATPase [Pseudolactococcus reticulitermitis]|uniref:AAA+ ATPase domain-containing protein n=1 Tax=Pseudolactococcus reticulitermitis TaxID=2025039 RepID=A0A224X6N1_9LACT|nr:AAA family ATPase [Lactococcus reticulitermitis]GAX48216.1 hypothetical protein RsY01_1831 [Lactococcus reticulitermitis]